MAAGAWTFYNAAKKHLMDATIDLDAAGPFKMALFGSTTNANTVTFSTFSQCTTGQVTEQFGYSSSGKTITAVTWATGASASEFRFDSTAVVWTAAGGSISAVKYAVVWQTGGSGLLLCYSQLSTAQFSVTSGNTLTITPSANGYFELN